MEYTEWFDATQQMPVRKGWYDCEYQYEGAIKWRFYFNGHRFLTRPDSSLAMPYPRIELTLDNHPGPHLMWRGRTEPGLLGKAILFLSRMY